MTFPSPGLAVAAAACVALAAPTTAQANHPQSFRTPTGKIQCAYFAIDEAVQIRCDLLFLNDRAVVLKTSGKARKIVATDTVSSPSAKTLAYGTSIRYGSFTCTSRTTGLTCTSRRTGHGFTVSRESQKVFSEQ